MLRGKIAAIGLIGALVGANVVAGCATPPPSPRPSAALTASPSASPTPIALPAETPSTSPPSPSPTASPTPPSAVFVTHGSRASKSIALTFDDGFNVPACISIVGTLLEKHATATFFPNGQYVREAPSFWHWVASHGFPVGSHGTTHHDPTTLSAQNLLLSLGSERRILDQALGVPSIDAYRPPYGSYNSVVLQVAGLAGYPLAVGWDVDSRDQLGVASVAQEVANATTGMNGSIVLMHCGSPLTPLALPAIIESYRARGFTFVTIPQMLGLRPPAAAWAPPASPDDWPTAPLPATGDQPAWNASPATDYAGRVHVAYETPSGIAYEDDATGAGPPVIVARSTDSTFVSRPALALEPMGHAHLVYLSATASGTQLLYRDRGTDGTWSGPSLVATLSAPASTATVTIDHSGQPLVAYAQFGGAQPGIVLARLSSAGWNRTVVPTTDRTFLSPSIALDRDGAIHVFTRRNGHSEIDETTNASGAWATTVLRRVTGSGVPFGAYDPSGRLVVAVQPSFGGGIDVGERSSEVSLAWGTITAAGDLSGLAISPVAGINVAFTRIAEAGGPSRIWIAQPPQV
jgi:peptidoglycan/xylan/chitin deacetylase (PgdA/CDA1 family)